MDKKNYELAEEDYIKGMKYKDIADKYGVSINTVKSWKNRYKWCKIKSVHTKNNKKGAKEIIAPEIEKLANDEELNDNQKLFCVIYSRCLNATKAYQRVYNCTYENAMVEGCKALRNPKIDYQIKQLISTRFNKEYIKESILQKYLDIAFADINDYVSYGFDDRVVGYTDDGQPIIDKTNYMEFKDSVRVDGTIISEIKTSRQGASIKLHDKLKALDWLSNFFEMNPEFKHKKEYDYKKFELEKERFNYQKDKDNEEW